MALNKNHWVRRCSAGIWRFLSEVPARYEMRSSPDKPKEFLDGPMFIAKRLVNNKWKRAFETEWVNAALIKPRRLTRAVGFRIISICGRILPHTKGTDQPRVQPSLSHEQAIDHVET